MRFNRESFVYAMSQSSQCDEAIALDCNDEAAPPLWTVTRGRIGCK